MLQVPALSKIADLEPVTEKSQAVAATGTQKSTLNKRRPVTVRFAALGIVVIFLLENLLLIFLTGWYFPVTIAQWILRVGFFAILTAIWLFILKAWNDKLYTKHFVLGIGTLAFLATGLLFVLSAIGYPQLYHVCWMNPYYKHGDKTIGRDTQPISYRDARLMVDERINPDYYVITEDLINKSPYIDMNPIYLLEMHDHLKGGLELSYNFHEKYQKLVFYYWARFVVFAVLTVASFVLILAGLFMPKHAEDVGDRGGETWE